MIVISKEKSWQNTMRAKETLVTQAKICDIKSWLSKTKAANIR